MSPQQIKQLATLYRKLAEHASLAVQLSNDGYEPESRQELRIVDKIEYQIRLLQSQES